MNSSQRPLASSPHSNQVKRSWANTVELRTCSLTASRLSMVPIRYPVRRYKLSRYLKTPAVMELIRCQSFENGIPKIGEPSRLRSNTRPTGAVSTVSDLAESLLSHWPISFSGFKFGESLIRLPQPTLPRLLEATYSPSPISINGLRIRRAPTSKRYVLSVTCGSTLVFAPLRSALKLSFMDNSASMTQPIRACSCHFFQVKLRPSACLSKATRPKKVTLFRNPQGTW